MNLDDWIALSAEQRNELRKGWKRSDERWLSLLGEALQRFKRQYSGHPKINYFSSSAWHAAAYEPSIIVMTALWSPQIIEELPDRFLTFRVVQEQVEDTKDYYLRMWTVYLTEFAGWDADAVLAWAEKNHREDLNGRPSLFTHELPLWYVWRLLVPEDISDKLEGAEWVEMERRIRECFRGACSDPFWCGRNDFDLVRRRLRDTFAEFRSRI